MKHRVTKQFKFEMAHRLPSHKGACKYVHGHSYVVDVTVEAESRLNENGMVLDFSLLKQICNKLFDNWDHALMLQQNDPLYLVLKENGLLSGENKIVDLMLVPYEPTAENMAKFIYDYLENEFMLNLDYSVYKIKVWETTTSYAEYGN